MNVKTNVFRDNGMWCHATWVDGEFDSSDPLDIPEGATEDEAKAAARQMFDGRASTHEINRVDDIYSEGG